MNKYDPARLLSAISEMVVLNEFSRGNPSIPDVRERLRELLQILIRATDCEFGFIVELRISDEMVSPISDSVVSTFDDTKVIATLREGWEGAGRPNFKSTQEIEMWAISAFPLIETFCTIPIFMNDVPVSLVGLANRESGFTGTESEDLDALVRFIYVVYRALRFFGIAIDTVALESGRRAVAAQSNVWFGRKDMWSGLSHDLNGIFAVIALQSELMRTQIASPIAISKGLDRIDAAVDQIGQLTARLDLLGQLQGSDARPTPLLDGARTFEFLSRFLFAQGGQLVVTIDCPVEVYVPLSGQELLTVLHAVLSNSFEANAQDLMPIYVDIFFDSDDTVALKVTNSGPRFDDDVLSQIFTKKITTHRDAEGKIIPNRGFGLLAVKTILDSVNGTINIESSEIATQVTVSIPIAPSPAQFHFYYRETSR